MHILFTDGPLPFGVEEDDIGIGSLDERAFSGVDPKQFRRIDREQSYEIRQRHATGCDKSGVQKWKELLRTRYAGEYGAAILRRELLFTGECTVVGRDHLEFMTEKGLLQLLVVVGIA